MQEPPDAVPDGDPRRSAGDRSLTTTGSHHHPVRKARLEAFSDGVFAIAVTLLVLELNVPPPDADLVASMAAEWPAFLAYLISFSFIGGSWIAHVTTTRFLDSVNAVWMRLNLLLLLLVCLLPFTTKLLATHLNGTDARTAALLFGTNLSLAAALISAMIAYAANAPGLAADDVAEAELAAFEKERRAALLLQCAATALALFFPLAATAVFLAVSMLLLLDPLFRIRQRPTRSERS